MHKSLCFDHNNIVTHIFSFLNEASKTLYLTKEMLNLGHTIEISIMSPYLRLFFHRISLLFRGIHKVRKLY
jgi:hypothetical protein